MSLILREAAFRPSTVDVERRTTRLLFSTGAPVRRQGPDGPYLEVLEVTPAAVRLDRLNQGAPLLDSHRASDLSSVLGVVERAWIENGAAWAEVRFRETDEAEAVLRDVASGALRNASVGYAVHTWREEERDGLLIRTATDWEPYELSLVPIPAEAGAGVRSFNNSESENTMSSTNPTLAERRRVTEIRRAVRTAGLPDRLADDLIEAGAPIDAARAKIIDLLAAQDERDDTRNHVRVEDGDYGGEGDFRAAVVDGLLQRHGVAVRNAHPAAEDFARMGIRELASTLLSRAGVTARRTDTSSLVERAMTSADLPALLANVAEKAAMIGFTEHAPATHRVWTREGTLRDFKEAKRVALSEAPALEPVREHGEVTHGSFDDAGEPIRLRSYGRIVSLTREALINDDLGELTRIPAALGAAARRLESDLVYGLLANGNGPTMRDGKPLFSADHGNIAETGGALTIETLAAARAAMRKQKGLAGQGYVDPRPAFLVVPVALESQAEQLLATLQPNAPENAVPEWIRRLAVVADPRLDDLSSSAWYLVADPSRSDTLEVARLDGQQPQIATREGFDVAAMQWRVLFDVGAAVLDWRGFFKNPGASSE